MTSRPTKRRKKSTLLVEDNVEASEAVTHQRIMMVTKSGTTKTKNILVPLIPVVETSASRYGGQDIRNDPVDCEGNYNHPDVEHNFSQHKSKVKHVASFKLILFLIKRYVRHSMIM